MKSRGLAAAVGLAAALAGAPAARADVIVLVNGNTIQVDAWRDTGDAIEFTRKSGKTEVIALTPEQKAAMKAALVPVHKENESRVGRDTIAEVYKVTGFKP